MPFRRKTTPAGEDTNDTEGHMPRRRFNKPADEAVTDAADDTQGNGRFRGVEPADEALEDAADDTEGHLYRPKGDPVGDGDTEGHGRRAP